MDMRIFVYTIGLYAIGWHFDMSFSGHPVPYLIVLTLWTIKVVGSDARYGKKYYWFSGPKNEQD